MGRPQARPWRERLSRRRRGIDQQKSLLPWSAAGFAQFLGWLMGSNTTAPKPLILFKFFDLSGKILF